MLLPALFAAVALAASTAPTVIPTPAKMTLSGETARIDGFALRGDVPAYAREMGAALFRGSVPLAFAREAALGGQRYRLRVGAKAASVAYGDDAGAIYAVATLKQLAEKVGDGFRLALGEVDDRPAYAFRGINWLQFVESRNWSMDAGLGAEDFFRRAVDGLDLMADLKLNLVFVDGLGWNPERFPGYGRLMSRLAAEARRRAIRLCYSGYTEGYGAQWLKTDGPLFLNERKGAAGTNEVYACVGVTGSRAQRVHGSCLSNDDLMARKLENLKAFVRAVEPGALYAHGIDLDARAPTDEAWRNRCPACRARWPNDDVTAPDGAVGAFAHLYDSFREAVSSVKNPATGYDGARDCLLLAVAPNYTIYCETDDAWRYHEDYFENLSRTVRNKETVFLLREQYVGEDGQPRFASLRRRLGEKPHLGVIEFLAGDGYYNFAPVSGEMVLAKYFKGCDVAIAASGHALVEPRQALWAEYLWNPEGTAYPWEGSLADLRESARAYDAFCQSGILPPAIFRERDGLLAVVCRKLYGDEGGPLVAKALTVEHLGIPAYRDDVSILLPLSTERLPGSHFSRFRYCRDERRVVRWKGSLDERDVREISNEIVLEKASIAKTIEAIALFRRAAETCPSAARRATLLRMADCCETSVRLGNLTLVWLDLILRGRDCTYAGWAGAERFWRDVDRFEAEAKRWRAHFTEQRAKMTDVSGGFAYDGLMTAEFLLKEVENMRVTRATGKYPPHPAHPWW